MEDAVNSSNESSDLCKKIILGQRVDDLPGKLALDCIKQGIKNYIAVLYIYLFSRQHNCVNPLLDDVKLA